MKFRPTREQRRILRHPPTRHARVLAGPGTGKSTTMVRFLQKLPSDLRVRMLSFTRAATSELAQKFSDSSLTTATSTVHSFAISVLLRNPGVSGLPEPLRIADNWETENIVNPTLAKRIGVRIKTLEDLLLEMAANFQSLTEEQHEGIDPQLRQRFRGAWDEHRRVFGYTLLAELPYALHRALEQHDHLAARGRSGVRWQEEAQATWGISELRIGRFGRRIAKGTWFDSHWARKRPYSSASRCRVPSGRAVGASRAAKARP